MEISHETTKSNELHHGATLVSMTPVRLLGLDPQSNPIEFKAHRGILVRCPGSTSETNAGQPVNTHPVYIGGEKVTPENGIAIPPGNAIHIPIEDPSKLWVISTGNSQRVTWISL